MLNFTKASWKRGVACLLVLLSLLTVWGVAETMPEEQTYMPNEVIDWEAVDAAVQEASESEGDPEVNVVNGLVNIVKSTGIYKSIEEGEWRQYAMIAVACVLLYLAIVKEFEPLLLLPIAFGMLLANLPAAGMMSHASYSYYDTLQDAVVAVERLGKDMSDITWRFNEATGTMQYSLQTANAGLL